MSKKIKNGMVKRFTVADALIWTFFILFSFITIYPIYYVIIGSLNQGQDFIKGGIYLWPRVFSLDNYAYVLTYEPLWHGFLITIGRTVIGTFLHVFCTSAVAYAMGRKILRFRKFYYWFSVFTMFFGGGIVPYFLLIKLLRIYNTFWVYIIPGMYSVYDMIVISSFMRGIPTEMIEAAEIEGAGEYRIFLTIMIPLSLPILATIALWSVSGHWNAYIDTMYYAPSQNLWSLQYVLKQLINATGVSGGGGMITEEMLQKLSSTTVSYAAIVIATIPILAVYPFLQKHFEGGYMIGSLKG